MFKLIAKWRQDREAIRELSGLSDRDLADLGLARADIADVVSGASAHGAALSRVDATPTVRPEDTETLAPSWAAQNRASLAA